MLDLKKRKLKNSGDNPDLFGNPGWDKQSVIEGGDRAIEFILAGKAKITIRSDKTGKHYTYKIRKGDGELWFVSGLTERAVYRYLGTLFPEGFRATAKSQHKKYRWLAVNFEAFDWFWRKLNSEKAIPPGVSLFHAGKCGMCGIELTDPVSLKEGYGPECRKKRLRRKL